MWAMHLLPLHCSHHKPNHVTAVTRPQPLQQRIGLNVRLRASPPQMAQEAEKQPTCVANDRFRGEWSTLVRK
jgi:hypothetical protein